MLLSCGYRRGLSECDAAAVDVCVAAVVAAAVAAAAVTSDAIIAEVSACVLLLQLL